MSIEQIVILLFIGYIIFAIDTKKEDFPVPTVLVLLGIGLAFFPFFDSIELTEDIIYHIFLPALLFISAYQLPIKKFRQNIRLIISLATIGIILTVLLLGFLISVILPIGITGAFLLAAILTPTDPVSVVSIIKKTTGNEQITSAVEGEAMLNDGTSIVLFTTLFAIATREQGFSLLTFIGDFLFVSLGGIGIGIICGFIVNKIFHYSHYRNYQIMLSIILAYGSFLIAEALHVSGVLATVAGGMIISYGLAVKETHIRDSLDGFWEIIENSLLAILFLVIGIEVTEYLAMDYWLYAGIIFLLMIAVRFIICYVISNMIDPLSWRWNMLLSWAGLKGSMSVFLILTLHAINSNSVHTELIVGISFTVILLSLTIQSLSMAPISRWLLK
ncbi:cation:proton antiporter [Gracilibacillus sp. HCP3S3_G5_1]|uniref:cation:proton antiporter n=1 Tax=unclassified Gracilibacillus TaxID=2625209 RepID=UPI003F8C6D9E